LDTFTALNTRKGPTKFPFLGASLDLFFPNTCLLCQERIQSTVFYCHGCEQELDELAPSPLPETGKGKLNRIYSFTDNTDILYGLIKAYKYVPRESLADHLSFFLYRLLAYWDIKTPFILPVPAHPASIRQRGFSNTERILISLKHRYLPDLQIIQPLRRVEWNYQPQASFKEEEKRKHNVRNVFKIKRGTIIPESIVLFDDVYTSGATVSEICRVLSPFTKNIDLFVLVRK
jgi:ComF family protein